MSSETCEVPSTGSCEFYVSPCTPTSDADALHDVHPKLTDVHEEEDEESERAIAPAETEDMSSTVDQ